MTTQLPPPLPVLRKLNFKASPVDHRDHKLVIATKMLAPKVGVKEVDLSSGCTPVRDQGSVGACTAYSSIGLFEYIFKKYTNKGDTINFSEKFTYYTTRVEIEKCSPDIDGGGFVRDALKSLVKYGACPEELCPYLNKGEVECNYKEKPSNKAYEEALNFQALTYTNIPEGNTMTSRQQCLLALKQLLQEGHPFIGGFNCYSNMYDGQNGVILPPNGEMVGGHAIFFVGYNDQTKMFKFKNSWGPGWGDHGYGYLPYSYLLSGDLSDLWSIFTEENNNQSIGTEVVPGNKTVLLGGIISDGLRAITEGREPTIPEESSTFSKADVAELRGFFNRITTMKSQLHRIIN